MALYKFLSPRPQGNDIFGKFIPLLDSSHGSCKNEVLFVNFEALVVDYNWIRQLSPSGPNVNSRFQAPRSGHHLIFHDFIGLIT